MLVAWVERAPLQNIKGHLCHPFYEQEIGLESRPAFPCIFSSNSSSYNQGDVLEGDVAEVLPSVVETLGGGTVPRGQTGAKKKKKMLQHQQPSSGAWWYMSVISPIQNK